MDKLFQEMQESGRILIFKNAPVFLLNTTPYIRHAWFYTEGPCNDWCEFAPLIKPTEYKIEIWSN